MDEEEETMNVSSDEDSPVSAVINAALEASSSDVSDDEEAQLEQQADELEKQIASDKYLYDAHVQLVEIYRKLGDLKSLREACERFRECFPLTPAIWLAWIKDEIKIASSAADKENVLNLFALAVQDYLSVELWQEYAQFSIGVLELSKVREILEKGLSAAGMHVASGSLLWDTLRELEFAHFSAKEPQSEEWKSQLQRVYDIFKRQLSVPLLGMESTYEEFEQWFEQLPEGCGLEKKAVTWGYERALKALDKYKPFEDRFLIAHDENEILHIYKEYIKVAAEPALILNLYERAVAQLSLNTDLWADYCNYTLKLGEIGVGVTARAVRNCPWSEELWILRLRTLEKQEAESGEVLKQFEQGISCVPPPGLELWLVYIEYVRRHEKSSEKLHKLFQQAIEQIGVEGDPSCKLLRFQGRLLAAEGKLGEARRNWGEILKNRQHRESAVVWLEYIGLERRYGEEKQLRGLFQRAIGACRDWPQYLVEEWLMFEREVGTLEDVLKCVEKSRELKQKLLMSSATNSVEAPEPSTNGTIKSKKRRNSRTEHDDASAKRQKPEETQLRKIKPKHDPNRTVFVSNLSPTVTEEDLNAAFPNADFVNLVLGRKGVSKRFAYVQLPGEEDAKVALNRDRELLKMRPMFISKCRASPEEEKQPVFKYDTTVEPNKLFVKGLPLRYSKQDVEQLFKPYGCTEVRIITHKSGRSKGLAYVEFPDEKMASEALKATDQLEIGEHTITVAISAPPPKQDGKFQEREPVRHARSRLQIPLVPRVLQTKVASSSSDVAPKSNDDFRKMLLSKNK